MNAQLNYLDEKYALLKKDIRKTKSKSMNWKIGTIMSTVLFSKLTPCQIVFAMAVL
jgi:hypothetical protein